jgi:hypothetical protein
VGRALHPLNLLLATKTPAAQEKMAQATTSMMVVMVTKLPGMKKTLLRLMLQSRNFRNIRAFEATCAHLYVHGIVTLA